MPAARLAAQAPETLMASRYAAPVTPGIPKGDPVSTRPLCAYPKVARWVGKGSPDEAQNYVLPCRRTSMRAS